eukprot:scaffold1936_cov362-Pinguiococcus_pyrenoidosus.AAC.3
MTDSSSGSAASERVELRDGAPMGIGAGGEQHVRNRQALGRRHSDHLLAGQGEDFQCEAQHDTAQSYGHGMAVYSTTQRRRPQQRHRDTAGTAPSRWRGLEKEEEDEDEDAKSADIDAWAVNVCRSGAAKLGTTSNTGEVQHAEATSPMGDDDKVEAQNAGDTPPRTSGGQRHAQFDDVLAELLHRIQALREALRPQVDARNRREDFSNVLTELRRRTAARRERPFVSVARAFVDLHLRIPSAHFAPGNVRDLPRISDCLLDITAVPVPSL